MEIINSDHMLANSTLKIYSITSNESTEAAQYSRCLSLHILIQDEELIHTAKMITVSTVRKATRIKSGHYNITIKYNIRDDTDFCTAYCKKNFKKWKLEYRCVTTNAGRRVSVSSAVVGYKERLQTVQDSDPVPQYHLSVDTRSKLVNVTVKPGTWIYARLCYQQNHGFCKELQPSVRIAINPTRSLSAVLNVSYLLPCVCVQVYYNYSDARRETQCPFRNISLHARDVWLASEITLNKVSVAWRSECPSSDLKPSASLCWKEDPDLCTPLFNSSLEMMNNNSHLYNISNVDEHPQMCLKFSLRNNHHIYCPFKSEMSTWEAHIKPGWRSVLVYLKSTVPAKFSAQLCVPSEKGCYAIGHMDSGKMDEDTVEMHLNLPCHSIAEKPCVQVWQSKPAKRGKRILCPEYTHRRSGMFAVAAFVIVVMVVLVGFLVQKVVKSGTAGWLSIRKPVLLVCSSEKPAHMSAVCALASILQGELGAMVLMALWNQGSDRNSSTGAGAQNGVADLGPLPWLYSQWDAVHSAEGKVLIIWSPEAKNIFEKIKKQRTEMEINKRAVTQKGDVRLGETMEVLEEDWKLKARVLKYRIEKAITSVGNEKDDTQKECSSTTGPVLTAALTRLQGVLQEQGQSHRVVLISLHGLSHNRDIPNELRGVPRYCLPKDFRGLIRELGGMAPGTNTENGACYCWPRLLTKILSVWLARRLANQLKSWLP